MSSIGEQFLGASRRSLARGHERVQDCLGRLNEEQIWWRSGENTNAVGNLVLHLCGNVRQWIVSGAGGAPDARDRDAEFARREVMPTAELTTLLASVVAEADQVMARLTAEELLEQRRIQVYDVTVLEAVHHSVEHFGHHTGQILYITKMATGADLGYYRFLSKKQG